MCENKDRQTLSPDTSEHFGIKKLNLIALCRQNIFRFRFAFLQFACFVWTEGTCCDGKFYAISLTVCLVAVARAIVRLENNKQFVILAITVFFSALTDSDRDNKATRLYGA